mmetsp:Transcript_8244/g.9154  ORF Transcript_8244/g.9154 Transcript_8244/m.9154 type:complete len:207 (+) Transcript_8244:183-803(+)
MVVLEVVHHTRLILVAADKDDLEALLLGLVFCVELCKLGRETAARRAPMSTEVQPQGLSLDGLLAHCCAVLPDESVAESLPERLGDPGKATAVLKVLHHLGTPVLGDDLPIGAKDDERWDATDFVLFAQGVLCITLVVRKRQPGHVAIVLIELLLGLVAGDKNSLEALGFRVLRVELAQLGSEASARRTPMRREVHEDRLLSSQGI